jgi:hypothetical protein
MLDPMRLILGLPFNSSGIAGCVFLAAQVPGHARPLLVTAAGKTRRTGSRRLLVTQEQVSEHAHGIADIEFPVTMKIRGVQAGRLGVPQEEEAQDEQRIADVDHAICVRVSSVEGTLALVGHAVPVFIVESLRLDIAGVRDSIAVAIDAGLARFLFANK